MYECKESIYCYKGTHVLKNKLNIRNDDLLKEYQTKVVAFKLSTINFIDMGNQFDAKRLCFIHQYLFSDVFYFAGMYRKENISKDNFRFSEFEFIQENIERILTNVEVEALRNKEIQEVAKIISYYMTELNVLHPFREGNGRAIREFVRELAYEGGYVIDWSRVAYANILQASIKAVLDETEQIELLQNIMVKRKDM